MKLTRQFFLISITLVVAISYFSYNLQRPPENKPLVRIAVSKTPLSAPFYIADELGFFQQSCVDVQLSDVVGGKKSFELVMQAKADFGTSSDSVLAFKGLKRDDFVNLATFVSSDNDVKIVTREGSNILTSKDLFGKRIGVTRGTAGDYFLSTFLALGNVSNIEIINYAPDKLEQALIDNNIDVAVVWEPYAYKTLQSSDGEFKFLQTKNLHTLTFNLVARKSTLELNVEHGTCVLQALQQAINFIASEPVKTQEILLKKLATDYGFIQWVWPDYVFKLSLNRSLLLNLESQAMWAIETGMVSPRELPDFTQMISPQALKKVNSMAVSF